MIPEGWAGGENVEYSFTGSIRLRLLEATLPGAHTRSAQMAATKRAPATSETSWRYCSALA
eukprot:1789254-Rhodomonas_salina.3